MPVTPVRAELSGGYGYGSSKSDSSTIKNTINTLEKQKTNFETEKKKSNGFGVNEIDDKIKSLEKRIDNLKQRLDKLKQKDQEENNGECETCKNRRYQDGSDDPGVSFKMATKMSPDIAASAVRGHEMEHVIRNRVKAEQNDMKIVSQSVVIKTDVCPECGRAYVSGGTTRTSMKPKQDTSEMFNVGLEKSKQAGRSLNSVA